MTPQDKEYLNQIGIFALNLASEPKIDFDSRLVLIQRIHIYVDVGCILSIHICPNHEFFLIHQSDSFKVYHLKSYGEQEVANVYEDDRTQNFAHQGPETLSSVKFTKCGTQIVAKSKEGTIWLYKLVQLTDQSRKFILSYTSSPRLTLGELSIRKAYQLSQAQQSMFPGYVDAASREPSISRLDFDETLAKVRVNQISELKLSRLCSRSRLINILMDSSAAWHRHAKNSHYLVTHNARPAELDLEEVSELLKAVRRNTSLETIDLSGCELFKVPQGLQTLEEILATHPKLKADNYFDVSLLIRIRITEEGSLEVKDTAGRTLLSHAASTGCTRVAELLFRQGASLDTIDNDGATPFTLAKSSKHETTFERLSVLKNMHANTDNRSKAFLQACETGEISTMRDFISEGFINVNITNQKGENALHVLAQRGLAKSAEIAKALLDRAIDNNKATRSGKTSVELLNYSSHAKDLVKTLLTHRKSICLDDLNKMLATLHLQTENITREQLDDIVNQLTGVADIRSMWKERWVTYLSHLNSFKFNISGGKIVYKDTEQPLEGFTVVKFLPLYMRVLLEMIIRLQTNEIEAPKGIYSKFAEDILKLELLQNLEMLRVDRDTQSVEFGTMLPNEKKQYFSAIAENVRNKIANLQPDETYVLKTGFEKHAIYVSFSVIQDFTCVDDSKLCIMVRIDNLGSSCDHHHSISKSSSKDPKKHSERYYPYSFLLPLEYFSTPMGPSVDGYLSGILKAKFLGKDAGTSLIYDLGNKIKEKVLVDHAKTEELWTARKPQIAGNCVVENHHVGLEIRFANYFYGMAEPPNFYRWFRQQENAWVNNQPYWKRS